MFELHERLDADTVYLGRLPLSLVLLHKDANYPWCILVPQRSNVREIHHLKREDRMQLGVESCRLAEVMVALFEPTTMNVGVLGNIVPQLHMHHVARFEDDPAWPKAMWGAVPAKDYDSQTLEDRVARLRNALAGDDFTTEPGTGESDLKAAY